MPKSNIMLIWNEREIANEVKRIIESKDNEYKVFIGGDTKTDTSLTVPGTIIEELKLCDQAIVLIEGRFNNITNPNVMYELGYAISVYGIERTSIYLIGCKTNELPSDMMGIWCSSIIKIENIVDSLTEEQISVLTTFKQNESQQNEKMGELFTSVCKKTNYFHGAADAVCKHFLKKSHLFKINKMDIIVHYYKYRELLINIKKNTPSSYFSFKCSEQDLSFFLLFFVQGAYFHDDYNDLKIFIQELDRERDTLCEILQYSIDFSLNAIDFFSNIKANRKRNTSFSHQLDKHTFYRVKKNLNQLRDDTLDYCECSDENKEYYLWLITSIDEILQYLFLVRAFSTTDSDEQEALFKLVIESAKNCHEGCEKIKTHSESFLSFDRNAFSRDKDFLYLFEAYIYRNMSNVYKQQEARELFHETLINSFEFRKKLFFSYCNRIEIPDSFERNLKMEYYLSWYECKKYLYSDTLPEEKRFHEQIDENGIREFLRKEKLYDKKMKYYSRRIEELIKSTKQGIE